MALPTIKRSNFVLINLYSHRPRYSTSSPHPDHSITHNLISIFTSHHHPDDPQLKALAPSLTPRIVESVLGGLNSWRTACDFFAWASNQNRHGYAHNCYTFNALASVLSGARRNAQLRNLASDLVDSRCYMSPGALGFFIRCLGSVGMYQDANLLFDRVRLEGLCVPNSYTYNCLLEALSKSSGSVHMVEMRLDEMRDLGFDFDEFTFTPLLQVYCSAGHFDTAVDVFNEMCERGWVDSHVLSILVVSFSKFGKVDEAMELIQRIEEEFDICLNEKTFCALIHGFVKERRVDRALELFDTMKESGFTPHVSVFDVLISGLCKNRDVEKVMSLYQEMKRIGVHPDIGVFSKLVSSFPEQVLNLEFIRGMDAKVLIFLYNSVLERLVDDSLIDRAYSLLQAMIGDGEVEKANLVREMVIPDSTSFRIVIDGLLNTGKLDTALCLFQHMVQFGCEPSLLLYNNLIKGLCNANRLHETYELLRKMKESGFEPTQFTHNSIFGCMCKERDVESSLALLRDMRVYGHEPWTKHTILLVKELSKHGKAVEACNFLTAMVQEGFLPDMIAYSAAVDGLIKIQKIDQALELFNDVCSRGHCPDVIAYNVLINGLHKVKRISEAHDLLNQMVVKGLVPSVSTYNLFIDCWCKNGDIEQAMVCLSTMYEKGREPNVISYTTLIDGLCSSGRPDDALLLFSEMGVKGCAPNRIAFMALIHGLCKCGRPDAGLVYLREMEEKKMEPDTYVYVALFTSFISCIKLLTALDILRGMVHKGKFPTPMDKNYVIVKDAIHILLEDDRTSLDVKKLIAEGNISSITSF